jgi:hypothetical protein
MLRSYRLPFLRQSKINSDVTHALPKSSCSTFNTCLGKTVENVPNLCLFYNNLNKRCLSFINVPQNKRLLKIVIQSSRYLIMTIAGWLCGFY